ncbi:ABC transporter B family member 21 [Selaginella moellendorffii]|nr:ABC transporter B family member 21 [Selaginella moellendorffii]|eukprot:XP_002967417.2 ABC transporter B family member 21 [Selaginella moellendorffii]
MLESATPAMPIEVEDSQEVRVEVREAQGAEEKGLDAQAADISGLDAQASGISASTDAKASEVSVSIGPVEEQASVSTVASTAAASEEPDRFKAHEFKSLPFYKLFMFADWLDVLLMSLGIFGAVGNGMARPLMALIFGQVANAFGENEHNVSNLVHEVSKVALRYVFLGLGTGAAALMETSFWMCAGERQAARIRALYLKSILRQDVSFFDKGISTGEVLGRMSDDTFLIQDAIGEKVGKFVQLLSTFFGGFILAFIRGWRLALVVSSVLPLLVIAGATMAMLISKTSSRGQMAYADAGNIVQQAVGGIRTVASFTGEDKAVGDYDTALGKAYRAGVYQGLSSGFGMGCTLLTLYLSYALALWYGSKLILHNGYTGGAVINVMLSVLMGGMALGQASPSLRAFAAGQAAAYKMFEVIHRVPAIDSYNMKGAILTNVQGNIEIESVNFTYPSRPGVQILKGFCLSIPSGMTAALVGQSGSGKSTVISLLERFYDPQSGVVSIDGHDIRKLQLKWLRQQIGLVSQEPVLFGVSVWENVAYGKNGATKEDVQAACELANAARFISNMPQGYDTYVGHHGTQLSGGQKQRIAIARAILKNPRILLLDEATSALDAESERIVQKSLERVMVDRTTVIVAHRLSTIRDANSIFVFQQGKIVESGTHSSLLAIPDGHYSQLIKLQEMRHDDHRDEESGSSSSSSGSGSPKVSRRRLSSLRESSLQIPVQREVQESGRSHSRWKYLFGLKHKPRDGVSTTSSMLRLAALNKPEAPVFILGSVAAAVNAIVFPMFGLLLSSILGVFYNPDRNELRKGANFWASMFVVLACACFIIIPCQMVSFAYVGQNLIRRIRYLTFKTVLRQEIGWFDARENSSGAISSRLSTDAAYVRGMVGDSLALTVQNLATIAAGLLIAFSATWELALVIFALVPLLSLQGIMQIKVMTGFSADAKVMYEEASHVAADAISSIRSVASFCAEEKMLKLYEDKCRRPLKNGIRLGLVSGAGFGCSNVVMFSSYGLSFWYGAQLVKDRKTTFQKVFKVFFAITMSAIGVSHAAGLAPDLGKVKTSVISIFSMLDRKSKIDPADLQGSTLDILHGDVQFQHVSFKYPSRPDVQIFRDFTLFVEAGTTAALVGESGCGKSTAISLIQRFYDPDCGKIFIDGVDIRSLQLRWLRQQMALVGQEPVLFSGTLGSNIGYGKDGVSDDEIKDAAISANAYKFIMDLPDGFDTEVGERGTQLSGGQKQRIAIARAIVKNPKILLLDEATSALDAESERLVQEALNLVMQNRTVVVVAHRLSTIVNAGVISVVKNGVVAEQGRHKELLQIENGVYSLLVKLHVRS